MNKKIAEKLGLENLKILAPKENFLKKIVSYVPPSHHEKVLDRLCLQRGQVLLGITIVVVLISEGTGTFKGNVSSKPFIGKANELSREKEVQDRITVFESPNQNKVISALLAKHILMKKWPTIFTSFENRHARIGSGMVGEFKNGFQTELEFLNHVKKTFKVPTIKHTKKTGKTGKNRGYLRWKRAFFVKKRHSGVAPRPILPQILSTMSSLTLKTNFCW